MEIFLCLGTCDGPLTCQSLLWTIWSSINKKRNFFFFGRGHIWIRVTGFKDQCSTSELSEELPNAPLLEQNKMYFRAKSETKGSGSHWYESNVPLDFKLWSVKSLVCFTALHVRVNWKPIKEFIQEAATHFWSLDYFSRWFRSVSTFASSLVWHPSSPQSSYPSCHCIFGEPHIAPKPHNLFGSISLPEMV